MYAEKYLFFLVTFLQLQGVIGENGNEAVWFANESIREEEGS